PTPRSSTATSPPSMNWRTCRPTAASTSSGSRTSSVPPRSSPGGRVVLCAESDGRGERACLSLWLTGACYRYAAVHLRITIIHVEVSVERRCLGSGIANDSLWLRRHRGNPGWESHGLCGRSRGVGAKLVVPKIRHGVAGIVWRE